MRKIQWVAKDKTGKMVGVFPTRKKIYYFFNDDQVVITKLVWNGFYYSDEPIHYDPYVEGKIKLFDPMF